MRSHRLTFSEIQNNFQSKRTFKDVYSKNNLPEKRRMWNML